MSPSDDYRYDVSNTEFVDQDVERLISGESPRDPDLAELTSFMDALRSYRRVVPSIAAPEHLVAKAAESVRSRQQTHLDLVPLRADSRPDRRPSWLATRAAAAVASFILLIGVSAVAFAAHVSIPGDALYGLDRALEAVGIGDGSVGERVVEADSLVADGDDVEAITLLGETVYRAMVSGDTDAAFTAQRHLEEVTLSTSSDVVAGREKVDAVTAYITRSADTGIAADEEFRSVIRSIVSQGR